MEELTKPIERVFIDDASTDRSELQVGMLRRSLARAAISIVSQLEDADIALIVGGDGHFLQSITRHEFPDTPVAGVAAGSLNYFCETSGDAEAIDGLVDYLGRGEYRIAKLPLMELSNVSRSIVRLAVNEVLIERATGQTFHAEVNIDGGKFSRFIGDGLIICTPQGSSAYGHAAGGSEIQEGAGVYGVVLSNPHMNKMYKGPPGNSIVKGTETTVVKPLDSDWRKFKVTIDGVELPTEWNSYDEELVMRFSEEKYIHMVRSLGFRYYDHVNSVFNS